MLKKGVIRRVADDFTRQISGAFLFGVPLLYTMEMWSIGQSIELGKLTIFLVLAFFIAILLAYFGVPSNRRGWWPSVSQALQAMAVGVVTSILVLLVLNRISTEYSLASTVGQVVILSIPLGIGAAAADSMLAMREDRNRMGSAEEDPGTGWRATLNDLSATLAGGLFISLPVAPTDEITVLSQEMSIWYELALVVLTLLVTYAIVFESGFSPQQNQTGPSTPFQHPITETVMAYILSLTVALVTLYLFDRIHFGDPLEHILSMVIVLSFPAAVGGAAGRLVI